MPSFELPAFLPATILPANSELLQWTLHFAFQLLNATFAHHILNATVVL